MPWRWATALTLAPGSSVSATISCFSDRRHRRRRSIVMISARCIVLEVRLALLLEESLPPRRARCPHRALTERTERLIDQLALRLEEFAASVAEDELAAEIAVAKTTKVAGFTRKRAERNTFPDHLPRERVVIDPPTTCGCCGGTRLRKLGEDVTRTLEVIPRQWKVIETVREKFRCRDCEKISQAPAPFHGIARGWAGAHLLAMILFEKFGQPSAVEPLQSRFRPPQAPDRPKVTTLGPTRIPAELGDLSRFAIRASAEAYLDLVPSEHSSGASVTRGGMTKAGNGAARRLLIEAARSSPFPARIRRNTSPASNYEIINARCR
jgi:hypothetical protein